MTYYKEVGQKKLFTFMGGKPRKFYLGKRFERLLVIEDLPLQGRGSEVRCLCDCGNVKDFLAYNLSNGHTKSCGCLAKEKTSASSKTHGKTKTDVYRIWQNVKTRCINPNSTNYIYYGARGIQVCDRWLNSFENFLADMGNRPSNNHSLDRIDVNGDYTPENCRWATHEEQANNKRNNRLEIVGDIVLTVREWEKELGFPCNLLHSRLSAGMTMAEAIDKPYKPNKPMRKGRIETVGCVTLSVREWEKELGFPPNVLLKRLDRGMSMEEAISKPLRKKKPRKVACA